MYIYYICNPTLNRQTLNQLISNINFLLVNQNYIGWVKSPYAIKHPYTN